MGRLSVVQGMIYGGVGRKCVIYSALGASTVLTTGPPAAVVVGDEDFSMAEAAKHTAKFGGDCWIVVEGVIHNTTSYIEKHPGGPQWISDGASNHSGTNICPRCQDKSWLQVVA